MSNRSFRLNEEIEKKLTAFAEQHNRSKNWIVNDALDRYLKAWEVEEQRWQETLEALEDDEADEVVDAEEVHAWMRSWGTPNEKPMPKPKTKK